MEDALSAEELAAARGAMDRLSGGIFGTGPPLPDDWYEGCRAEHVRDLETHGKDFEGHLKWAWAFDKAIERLAVHPAIWPIILELTQGRPQLSGPGERVGVAIYDDVHTQGLAGRFGPKAGGGTRANWHCTTEGGEGSDRRENGGYNQAKLEVLEDGSLYCTNFVVFPYLVSACVFDRVTAVCMSCLTLCGRHAARSIGHTHVLTFAAVVALTLSFVTRRCPRGRRGTLLGAEPGSHRVSLNRPRGMLDWPGHPAPAPPGTLNVCPKA